MIEIIGAILPSLIQILGYFIGKSNMESQQKREFYEWAKSASKKLGSVKLHKYGEEQINELKSKPFKEST